MDWNCFTFEENICMRKRNRVICNVPSNLKEQIIDSYVSSGTWRDKMIFSTMVKHYITFPSKYFLSETDSEWEKVISAIEKGNLAEIGFSLTDFDFNHLKHVSDLSFRSITQQSVLAICSMALYLKRNKIKSFCINEEYRIILN